MEHTVLLEIPKKGKNLKHTYIPIYFLNSVNRLKNGKDKVSVRYIHNNIWIRSGHDSTPVRYANYEKVDLLFVLGRVRKNGNTLKD